MSAEGLKSVKSMALAAAFCIVAGGIRAAEAVSSFSPLNHCVYQFVRPDGGTSVFTVDPEEEHSLTGEDPWLAEIDGRRAVIMTDPGSAEPQAGFMFIDGFLRRRLADGRDEAVDAPGYSGSSSDLAALWPAEGERSRLGPAPDIWAQSGRLRLWFDNPNKAGILFAELALLALAFVFTRRLCAAVPAIAIFSASFLCILLSGSRGAFLAFFAGVAAIIVTRAKHLFSWRRFMIVFAALAVLAGVISAMGYADRFATNLFKEGGAKETSRLLIWKEVPRMIADAPGGWGFGGSARAYIDWYQKEPDCIVRDLISGHFTFLAEAGWPLSFGYLALWVFLLVEGARQSVEGAKFAPLAILAAYFVGNCFNPVLNVYETLTIPSIAAGIVLLRSRRRLVPICVAGAVSMLILCGVVIYGKSVHGSVAVAARGGAVVINGGSPAVWVADDDYALHGGYWWMFGNYVRKYFAAHSDAGCMAYTRSLKAVPDSVDKLVLVGETGRNYLETDRRPAAKEIVFLSPPFSWREVPAALLSSSKVRLVIGEIAARHCADYAAAPEWVSQIRGASLYIPNWQRFLGDASIRR